jgi:hypothetical protein
MRVSISAIVFFGSFSVFSGALSLVASVITCAPSIAVKADRFMTAMNVVTAGAMPVTLVLLFRRDLTFERRKEQ